MTHATNIKTIVDNRKLDRSHLNKPIENAAFVHWEGGVRGAVADYRKCSKYASHGNKTTPLFGTDNNLLKPEADDKLYGIETSESCMYSCIIWCKAALSGAPERNVHDQDKDEILNLFLQFRGHWKRAGGQRAKIRMLLSSLISNAGLTPKTNALSGDRYGPVLKGAVRTSGLATVIKIHSHYIATYKDADGGFYAFDNTVGCMKFSAYNAMEAWILWACEQNKEDLWVDNPQLRDQLGGGWMGLQCSLG